MGRLLSGIVYGSPRGPSIEVRWEERRVILRRMPPWLARRVLTWIARGDQEDGMSVEVRE